MEFGLPPIIDERSQILILGTFPIPHVNKQKEYYANPQNQFWAILSSVCNCDFVNSSYMEKQKLLLENHIALWDFIESCERKGSNSADRDLIPKTYNNIADIIKKYSNIKKICIDFKSIAKEQPGLLNAYNEVMKLKNKIEIAYIPSPSRMYPKPLHEKIKIWEQEIMPFCK